MCLLSRAGRAIQQLFDSAAEKAAVESGVIQRQRVLTARSLARIFVGGFMQNPRASDDELAQLSATCGTAVTAQAIDQRHGPRLVEFLKKLFDHASRTVIGADRALAPILQRFPAVVVLDSSTVTLPDGQEVRHRGCGGRPGVGRAAFKLQTELDLRSGAVSHLTIESARQPDKASIRQQTRRPVGSLRITDLGYFCLAVFAAMIRDGVHFLSRLQFGTGVLTISGQSLDLLPWLAQQPGSFIDGPILLGKQERLRCRLIAWRVPTEQANRQRHKLRVNFRRKRGSQPSAARFAWCDWAILITSVPIRQLTAQDAAVLYRARWQVELLFRRWKSQGLIADLSGSTEIRQMVRVWARLLAALVLHWLVTATSNGNPQRSLDKAFFAIRRFVHLLLANLDQTTRLTTQLAMMAKVLHKTCRRNRRNSLGTFELLNSPSRLNLALT
jgi:DDE family transposase